MEAEGVTSHLKAFVCGPGARGEEIKRGLAAANPGSMVQAIDAGAADNEFFLEMLAAQTLLAEETGSLLAKKREVDFLLRVAGTAQISRAIKERGMRPGRKFLVVVAGPAEVRGSGELDVPELPRRGLTKTELRRIERAAFLSAQRA